MKTRSNWNKVKEVERALWEAHRNVEAFRWPTSRLMDLRRAAMARIPASASRGDRAYVDGVAATLWTMTWSRFQWKLGNADMSRTAFNFTDAREELGGEHPTHGGFFWPSGELADKWEALTPLSAPVGENVVITPIPGGSP